MRPDADPRRVVARACCRVDLAGGTLDIWPLGLLHPGARTLNVAIDTEVRLELRRRELGYRLRQSGSTLEESDPEELARHPDGALLGSIVGHLELPPVDILLHSDSPRGGGLGASSAIAVAAIAAGEELLGRPPSSPERRSALARDLEARLMGLPTGNQDHYPALLGGALEILHAPGGERVRRLAIDLERLGASLVVAFTGRGHFSGGTNWQKIRSRLEGEPEVVRAFAGIAEAAAAMSEALEAGDLAAAGKLMGREWAHRRRLSSEVSTPEIEELLSRAAAAGAWGGKACGAGGGGSIAVLAPAEARAAVAERLAGAGARVLPTAPSELGVRVERQPG